MNRISRHLKSSAAKELRIIPIALGEEVKPGDSVSEKLMAAVGRIPISLTRGDVLVVKHKIISKAEGQLLDLASVRPSASSLAWGRRYGLDARVTELALAESQRVVRRKRGVLITQTHHGFICANAGVDLSNVDGGKHALLLPQNPDRSAQKLRRALMRKWQVDLAIIISDSFGRPWREGLTEVAIGVAGMKALHDYRGRYDPHGYQLRVSLEAVADELACAAGLVCGKLARTPACIIRGFKYQAGRGRARDLIRPACNDLFR
ncbi:MAG: coenzyme F420-0:L-glutamate ligase [Acidobacteria bacterium]|nr:coenzyme F420-0:L-glutamate ligase [Acidobacteriota bacterium]